MYGPPPAHPPAALPGPPGPPEEPASAAAPRGRRLAAWAIDTALLVGAAVLLGMMTWGRLNGLLGEGLWGDVLSATGGLLLSGGDVQKAAEDFGVSLWRDVVGAVEQALLLLVLIEFLHQFAGQALAGRTIGKGILDLRVDGAKTAKSRALGRSLVTTAGGTGLYCTAWILLLHGLFFFALVTWLAAVAVFLANSAPALVGARRRTLADLLAGTALVRADAYRRAAEAARAGAVAAWDGTQAAGQAAGQAVRDNAARLAQAEQVRRAVESERARQLQDLGRQSADRVRGAVTGERARQAQDAGRRIGGRLKSAYRDRRAGRDTPETLPPAPQHPALPAPQPHYDPYPQAQYDPQASGWQQGSWGPPADPGAPPPAARPH
ncbi:RDD family protein [Actinomadura meyerae]|uniref:RDD family protein n=1 Tax=Actinomadura meyerae TaxID=240840 RepID=A0A239K9Z7_9ACTN|nr:RDD family protein [Actinomadura meyerae]SNT14831.1 RDD family protein [Actinomadura meyerae]